MMKNGLPAIESESQVDVARAASLVFLKQMEVFSYSDPRNSELMILIARSYGSFAFGFLEEDRLRKDPKAATQLPLFYTRGRDAGLRALPRLKMQMGFQEWQLAISKMGKSKVPALFWTAFNWGNLILLKPDDPQNLIDLAKVEAMMRRVDQLQPDYHYGSVQTFFGSLLAMKPQMLGGNPVEAKKRFEKAIVLSQGKFLMNQVLFAQFYANAFDPALKKELLEKIESSAEHLLPSQELANQLAKRRAALLR